ncbi:MAG: hypothetical protein HC767_15210 [Akkermansiaceae bacterium]|nr:hypothetical protein [Akkermansiaceae bacterium]
MTAPSQTSRVRRVDPRIAWAVMVEDGGYGARTSAPIAGNLLLKARNAVWFATPEAVGSGRWQ